MTRTIFCRMPKTGVWLYASAILNGASRVGEHGGYPRSKMKRGSLDQKDKLTKPVLQRGERIVVLATIPVLDSIELDGVVAQLQTGRPLLGSGGDRLEACEIFAKLAGVEA
jgi:hypothetical protein